MAKSKFEKYRDILREETAKVKRGEKSNILNAGNFLASILFLVLVSVWSYYFTVARDSSRSVKKDRILKVVFLDTGPGDGAVIFSPSGKIGIIDSGAISGSPEADSDTAQVVHNNPAYKKIIPLLEKETGLKISSSAPLNVEFFAVSYPDPDHYGGFFTLLENGVLPAKVYVCGADRPYVLYQSLLELLKSKKIDFRPPAPGEIKDFGDGVRIKFLGPLALYKKTSSDDKNSSLVMKIGYGNHSVLFPGDVHIEAENDLGNWQTEIRSTVLKVPDHGSEYASSSPFLDRIMPEVAIISVASGNGEGLPSERVLKRFEERRIQLYRTDSHGNINFISDGSTWEIDSER